MCFQSSRTVTVDLLHVGLTAVLGFSNVDSSGLDSSILHNNIRQRRTDKRALQQIASPHAVSAYDSVCLVHCFLLASASRTQLGEMPSNNHQIPPIQRQCSGNRRCERFRIRRIG